MDAYTCKSFTDKISTILMLAIMASVVLFSGCSVQRSTGTDASQGADIQQIDDTQDDEMDEYDRMAEQARQDTEELVQQRVETMQKAEEENPEPGVSLEQCQAFDATTMTAAMCYSKLAIAEKDHSYCEMMQGAVVNQNRAQCFNSIATMLQDPSVCDAMTVPTFEADVLAMAKEQCRMLASQS